MKKSLSRKAREDIRRISDSAVLAAVLEAGAEKPGNVTPTHDYNDTTYSDYVKGAIALGSAIEGSAERGYITAAGETGTGAIGVGGLILKGVRDVKRSHPGGNTHLGMLLLMVPIAAAAGICMAKGKRFTSLRAEIKTVVREATKKDSRDLYAAIKEAGTGGISGLIEKDMTFRELMKFSASKDRIAQELSGDMGVIFDSGLPFFKEVYGEKENVQEALIWTYLFLLSSYPDTLIAKKAGAGKAVEVSEKAGNALRGRLSLEELDEYLRSDGNKLNPGTTADLSAAVLMIWLLEKGI